MTMTVRADPMVGVGAAADVTGMIVDQQYGGFGHPGFGAATHGVHRGDQDEQGQERRQKRRRQSLPDRGKAHAAL